MLVEAIHFISDPKIAKTDLPRFLRHETPSSNTSEGIGSSDYSRPPEAFLLGLGYTNDVVEELRNACRDVPNGLPWIVGGCSTDDFKRLVEAKSIGPPEQNGPITAKKQKKKLMEVLQQGNGGKDGVFAWYESGG